MKNRIYAAPAVKGLRRVSEWILLYVAFCTIMAISRQKEARSRAYALLLFRMISRVLYNAAYHRQHCTPHAFEQFGAVYMRNHDDKYPPRSGFEPGSSRLQVLKGNTACWVLKALFLNRHLSCLFSEHKITLYMPWRILPITFSCWHKKYLKAGGGPRVVVSTAAFHARARIVSIVGNLRDREVACSVSDLQGSNFESCVWRTVSYQSSHHPEEVLLAQFSLYMCTKVAQSPIHFIHIWKQ